MNHSSRIVLLSFLISCAIACDNYYKVADGACADSCLPDYVGICPVSLIVKTGGLSSGLCSDAGFTVADGSVSQKAGPCGTLTFKKYKKAQTAALLSSAASASAEMVLVSENELVAAGVPLSDEDCKWGLTSCSPSGYCSFQFRFGDLSLDQACRLRADEKRCPAMETVDVDPATYFDGRWYEIAASETFKTTFEKGLSCITADYYLNKCASDPVVVVNSGLKDSDNQPNPAYGRARQTGPGQFEVSFFGPFYGPYWVIHLEASSERQDAVAIVWSCSSSGQSMWVLSRTPTLPADTSSYEDLLSIARIKGVDVESLKMQLTRHSGCEYPTPEELSKKPSSDDECHLSLTGCQPSSWCEFAFDLRNPTKICRQVPTTCKDNNAAKISSQSNTSTAKDAGSKDYSTIYIAAGVVAGCVLIAGVAVVSVRNRRRATKQPELTAEFLRM